ncbi:D-alanyl-D-alanine carboxypeptidase family protein [Candidatus Nomurabacteria bacterium]|nr:D-alanyl-D-alanine carboxypeptidase family protein [Candidatus Nomurabacteria bacterium]
MGKFDPAQRQDFVLIPAEYNIAGYKIYLRKETLYAFEKMAENAAKDQIELNITSATRNFDSQRDLWNKKWGGATLVDGKDLSKIIPDEQERFEKILEYSAVPAISRHHWGTDIDINSVTPKFFETEKGKKVYEWLTINAPLFGFCQTYTLKGSDRPTGYNEEKWHWSYLPLSKDFTQKYKNLIKDEDIKGFDGDEYAPFLNLINDYVLSINPECI